MSEFEIDMGRVPTVTLPRLGKLKRVNAIGPLIVENWNGKRLCELIDGERAVFERKPRSRGWSRRP
jgi:hypothetical protein